MKAIQLFYIFIASFSLSFILSCIYFKIFGRKRANNNYCKAIALALDNAKDVYEVFKGEIPYIVDDICSKGLPSTIVDISKDDIRLVRQGDISFETIKEYYKECTK